MYIGNVWWVSDVIKNEIFWYFWYFFGTFQYFSPLSGLFFFTSLHLSNITLVPFAPQVLEINANHDLISKLHSIRHTNPRLAEMIAGQIFDNAMIAAGLVDDARTMLPRLQKILAAAMEGQEGVQDAQIESK